MPVQRKEHVSGDGDEPEGVCDDGDDGGERGVLVKLAVIAIL